MSTQQALTTKPLSEEQFKEALPPKLRKNVNKTLMDQVNAALTDPGSAEAIRDNILGYTSILRDGRYRLPDYINAVKYCSFKLMGSTNIDAYIKTFPDRYQNFLDTKKSDKDISAYVSIYNKGKLVTAIMEQTIIPAYILNQDIFQKALEVQVELMTTANSEKVRTDAANSILSHLKQPDKAKVEMDINVNDTSGVLADLRKATEELARSQRDAISSGKKTAEEIAGSIIIDVEAERVDD